MYRKWLGWKKVAVCLVGAAMVMQGASMTMAADEYPTEQNEPDYANEDQTAEDTAEGSTDSCCSYKLLCSTYLQLSSFHCIK